jgi:hypothetical protein
LGKFFSGFAKGLPESADDLRRGEQFCAPGQTVALLESKYGDGSSTSSAPAIAISNSGSSVNAHAYAQRQYPKR